MYYKFAKNNYFDNLEIGASYLHQKMSDNDLAAFNSITGRNPGTIGNFFGNPTKDRTDRKMGVDLQYDKGPFSFKGEYVDGEMADVTANWWYAMAGFKVKKIKTDFWIRYSQANYDQETYSDIRASGAWDQEQWTPLIVYHLHDRAKLYFEYYFNKENGKSGVGSIDNNYGFVELILFY